LGHTARQTAAAAVSAVPGPVAAYLALLCTVPTHGLGEAGCLFITDEGGVTTALDSEYF